MICGICKEREGEPITFTTVDRDGRPMECLCYQCQPVRCSPRREAVMATRRAENLREALSATR